MKEWFFSLLICTVLSSVIKIFLPDGEKSFLYAPLRFLFTLILTVSILHPFVVLSQKISDESISDEIEISSDPEKAQSVLLEKSMNSLEESVKKAFPDQTFRLDFTVGKDMVPMGICVECPVESDALRIADFLQKNFLILATAKETGGNYES